MLRSYPFRSGRIPEGPVLPADAGWPVPGWGSEYDTLRGPAHVGAVELGWRMRLPPARLVLNALSSYYYNGGPRFVIDGSVSSGWDVNQQISSYVELALIDHE